MAGATGGIGGFGTGALFVSVSICSSLIFCQKVKSLRFAWHETSSVGHKTIISSRIHKGQRLPINPIVAGVAKPNWCAAALVNGRLQSEFDWSRG
jgi:hypothetical protein